MYIGMESWTNNIHTGDCFKVLQEIPEDSVHACVTDAPYGLAFMGRSWDDFEPKEYQEWCQEWAEHVKRVLKPGGHLLAFSGNRTHHRLFSGVQDAGFEIRDRITYHFGSGFPKSSDISKTIDKRKGQFENRENVGMGRGYSEGRDETNQHDGYTRPWMEKENHQERKYAVTEPATPEAKKWDGWKTGLKPATEFVVMARNPFDGATVDCVQEHETGALNIKETRIGTDDDLSGGATTDKPRESDLSGDERTQAGKGMFAEGSNPDLEPAEGRYPSNVVFDELEAERLDKENGIRDDGDFVPNGHSDRTETPFDPEDGWNNHSMKGNNKSAPDSYGGKGGPSRYFYTSKASKAERTENGSIENSHPTVKPVDLIKWLVKMVTRETQIVIDPFTGSGTTCKAAKHLNRQFIGIEKQSKWADVARVRCNLTPENPSVVRADDAQQGFEAYADGGDD